MWFQGRYSCEPLVAAQLNGPEVAPMNTMLQWWSPTGRRLHGGGGASAGRIIGEMEDGRGSTGCSILCSSSSTNHQPLYFQCKFIT